MTSECHERSPSMWPIGNVRARLILERSGLESMHGVVSNRLGVPNMLVILWRSSKFN